jgi:hypothetical protein
MSRSRLHNPYHGILCAESEKQDKVLAHRRLRAAERAALSIADHEGVAMPELRDVSTTWLFAKDGKRRFDPERWPQFMRK